MTVKVDLGLDLFATPEPCKMQGKLQRGCESKARKLT